MTLEIDIIKYANSDEYQEAILNTIDSLKFLMICYKMLSDAESMEIVSQAIGLVEKLRNQHELRK